MADGIVRRMFSELAITIADGTVWLSIGQGLLFGAVCLLFGIWIARFVGLLDADAPAGETLGVGLTSGLLVLAAWWAAIASGGRSSFTPVAVGFAVAIGLAVVRRVAAADRPDAARPPTDRPTVADAGHRRPSHAPSRNLVVAVLGGAVFVVAVALLYGSTLILSPRDGVQPLEVMDTAYYSILGRDLAQTGTETIYSPSASRRSTGLPDQTWYHWGELWLAAAAITIFGTRRWTPGTSSSCRCSLLAAAGTDRHGRPADDRGDVARRVPLRLPRLPVPGARCR